MEEMVSRPQFLLRHYCQLMAAERRVIPFLIYCHCKIPYAPVGCPTPTYIWVVLHRLCELPGNDKG